MFVKLAPPTPTITMDSGSVDAATILSTVAGISDISPSSKRRKEEMSLSHHANVHEACDGEVDKK